MKNILLFAFIIFAHHLGAQELLLDISINFPTATDADKEKMRILENELQNFMNGTKWTNIEVKENEKIKGTVSLNIAPKPDPAATIYRGDILINVVRPVYGSTYTTSILNYSDNGFVFNYDDGFNLTKMNSGSFVDNLSAVASF